ncbi:mycofactocin-coupled SDR family oxidoreductase [Rhodococcus aetherivorans]
MARFEGKTVFITGAARGQGREHAIRFAREGANLIVIDLCEPVASVQYPLATLEDLAETERLVRAQGSDCIAVQADVRDEDHIRRVVDAGVARFGSLDVVVANAGICPMTGDESKIMTAWYDVLDIIVTGTLITLRATTPVLMGQEGGGSVVVVGSLASLRGVSYTPDMLSPGELGYGAAKHGVISLMKNYAIALGQSGVRVNAVIPGGVNTPMVTNPYFAEVQAKAPAGWMAKVIGGDSLIEPSDISSAVLWLASCESRYVTGHALIVDGGAHLL